MTDMMFEEDDYCGDEDYEYCHGCSNTGYVSCRCGGDLCFCINGGEMPCPKCDRGIY